MEIKRCCGHDQHGIPMLRQRILQFVQGREWQLAIRGTTCFEYVWIILTYYCGNISLMMVLCTKHGHTMHVHVEHNVLQNAGKHLINTAVADVLFGLVISGCVFMVEPFFEVRLWPKHATNSLECEAKVGESGACDLCDSRGDLVLGTRMHGGWKVDTSRWRLEMQQIAQTGCSSMFWKNYVQIFCSRKCCLTAMNCMYWEFPVFLTFRYTQYSNQFETVLCPVRAIFPQRCVPNAERFGKIGTRRFWSRTPACLAEDRQLGMDVHFKHTFLLMLDVLSFLCGRENQKTFIEIFDLT